MQSESDYSGGVEDEAAPAGTGTESVRDGIVAAAERLLAHYGYQKMTMGDLAREAGVGVGTIYLHFEGKADVAYAVVTKVHQGIVLRLKAIATDKSLPAEERLHRLIVNRVMLPYEGARSVRHNIEEIGQAFRGIIRERGCSFPDDFVGVFAGVLREGAAAGVFRFEEAAEEAARTIQLASVGLMPPFLRPEDFDAPERVSRRAEELARFLVRSVLAPPRDRP